MKKMLAFLMVFALLLCGCDGPVIPPSTMPSQVQIPETTKPDLPAPTQTSPTETVPAATVSPRIHPLHDQFLEWGFEYYGGNLWWSYDRYSQSVKDYQWIRYRYTGDSNVIDLPNMHLTLTLPDDWAGKFEILISDGGYESPVGDGQLDGKHLWVISKDLVEATCRMDGKHTDGHECEIRSDIYQILIYTAPKASPEESWEEMKNTPSHISFQRDYLGETDEYMYFMESPYYTSQWDYWGAGYVWEELKAFYTEEEFAQLCDNYPVTIESVREMVTFHNVSD